MRPDSLRRFFGARIERAQHDRGQERRRQHHYDDAREDRIAELTGKLNELESETTKEEARMCMELGRLVNILESAIHPDILNREEETQVNEFTGNF